jgi:hypothetical protein
MAINARQYLSNQTASAASSGAAMSSAVCARKSVKFIRAASATTMMMMKEVNYGHIGLFCRVELIFLI